MTVKPLKSWNTLWYYGLPFTGLVFLVWRFTKNLKSRHPISHPKE